MGKGPGLFTEIGKKAKDLLSKDYLQDQKFTVTTQTDTGLVFTSTGLKKGGSFAGDVQTKFQKKNITTEIKVDTNSKIFAVITADDVAPGVKTKFSFTIPDQLSGKVEVQYNHENAAINASVGLNAAPIVELNGAIGNEGVAVGGEVAFDTGSGALLKYNAGLGFSKADFSASLLLLEKGDQVKASYLHSVSPASGTVVAAEMSHRFSTNENTFTLGSSYRVDPLTTVKTRLNSQGKIAALLQHQWRPKSLVTFSGEVDTKALDKKTKVGLALALSP